MSLNFFDQIALLNHGMNLRQITNYMKILIPGWQLITKKPYKTAPNLIIHDHHVSKDTRVFTLDKLTSTEIYSILISKVQNNLPLTFILKICLMTMILTGYLLPCLPTYNT